MGVVRARSVAADAMILVAAIVGGIVAGSAFVLSRPEGNSAAGWWTCVGVVSGLVGTYLCLVLVVMVARVPWVENEFGHDRLVAYHRRLAPVAVGLVLLHVAAITAGWAGSSGLTWWSELRDLVFTYPWMMPAAAAAILFVLLSLMSIRAVRRVFRYETWWVAHTYFYLAIVLAVGHQLVTGTFFVQHPALRAGWIALYAVVVTIVLVWRVGVPVYRSMRHRLRVVGVVPETPGVVSVYVSGRNLDALRAEGGQFFQWRFLTRDWWWQAHPYSLSAGPTADVLRLTVKDFGDQSATLQHLPVGTPVAVEGPYGVFTHDRAAGSPVVCFAAGVGIAPIRALLDEFEPDQPVTVLYRVPDVTDDAVLLRKELEALFDSRPGWALWYLPGSRDHYEFTAAYLTGLVPHLPISHVYVCGPEQFGRDIETACRDAGVPKSSIHRELFVF